MPVRLQERGLTTEEARLRLARYGPNRLVSGGRRPSWLTWIVRPFTDPMVLLLLAAGAAYLFLGDAVDAAIVLVAAVPIALVSVILEARAERALDQLKKLTAPTAVVRRDDRQQIISAEEIVPGDLLLLQEGDVVPADGLLVEGANLVLDESVLTGESQPVTKDTTAAEADRDLFAGTTILSGRGMIRVTATGQRTRFGEIGTLVAGVRPPSTPLQRIIRRLIGQATIVAAGFCIAVAAIEIAYGHGWVAALTAGVSLAIAALPEEFAMVYTLYLTLGAWRLTRDRALVRRLDSVETLGATTVICTDKTGTLTLGRMDVAALATDGQVCRAAEPLDERTRCLIESAVLASEPRPFDPLEQAILRFAESHGVATSALHRGDLVADYPFDPILKYMSHAWIRDGAFGVYAKGSLEGILERSHASSVARRQLVEANQLLAAEGLRVIAVAAGDLPGSTGDRIADECHLQLLGLVAFADPIRPGVVDALRECCQAGIRVVMVTGDHPVTAHAVAEGLGLPHSDHIVTGRELESADRTTLECLAGEANIFARIQPVQKYRLVQGLRSQGQVVAMTGDGINDAPALRQADVGVAMGRRGTEVAREAADLVLLDDNFATIVHAVRDGRRIFENLRRAFSYLIAFEVPLLLLALVVPLVGAPLLMLPGILIWSELIVHPTASLVFENDPPPPDLMLRPPRPPGTGLLVTTDFIRSLAQGVALGAGVLVLYLVLLQHGAPEAEARGIALAALILGQMIMVLSARSPTRSFWRMRLGGNRVLPLALGLTLLSLALVLYVPSLAHLLSVAPISPTDWAIALAVAGATTLWLEPLKVLQKPLRG